MDFSQCACSGKTLGRLLRPAIMAVLAKEAVHGYLVMQRLEQMDMFKGHPPDATGVYRLLKSMEDDGLVSSAWDLADSGPARRIFKLTADGHACLQEWLRTLRRYRDAMDELLDLLDEVPRRAGR